jgi:hypothetical protein
MGRKAWPGCSDASPCRDRGRVIPGSDARRLRGRAGTPREDATTPKVVVGGTRSPQRTRHGPTPSERRSALPVDERGEPGSGVGALLWEDVCVLAGGERLVRVPETAAEDVQRHSGGE